mgnify:CR=1 FL=1
MNWRQGKVWQKWKFHSRDLKIISLNSNHLSFLSMPLDIYEHTQMFNHELRKRWAKRGSRWGKKNSHWSEGRNVKLGMKSNYVCSLWGVCTVMLLLLLLLQEYFMSFFERIFLRSFNKGLNLWVVINYHVIMVQPILLLKLILDPKNFLKIDFN